MDTHAPCVPPREHLNNVRQFPHEFALTSSSLGQAWVDAIDRYDASILFVDQQLAQLENRLKRLGLWDQIIIVVTADHGEEFLEHGEFLHHQKLYDELIRIPLIIKLPRGRHAGELVSFPVEHIDLMPTLLALCEVSTPEGQMMGANIGFWLERDAPDRRGYTLSEAEDSGLRVVAVRTPAAKYMAWFDPASGQLTKEQYFDLLYDQGELRPESDGEFWDQLKEVALDHLVDPSWEPRRDDVDELDHETRTRLKALGYIE